MPDKESKRQEDWEFPDYSKATPDERLNGLLAMRDDQPEDALTKADRNIPRLPRDGEKEK